MSLLTELDSFTLPFLQICQSYGLRRLRVLRATKNSNAKCPKRPTQNDLARRSSHRDNRKLLRSSGRESAPSKHRPQNNEPIHIGCYDFGKGSATVPVAVFGVAPKTLQQTNLSNDVSGATPEPARKTRALPQTSNAK
jgi:hypothetical protein